MARRRGRHGVAALTLSAVALVLAASLVAHDGPLALDRWIRSLVLGHVPQAAESLSAVLTQLGSGAVLYPVLVLLACWRRTYYTAALPAVLAAGQVLEVVALSALPRTPPGLFSWASLSSGRTATAVLGWGLVALALAASARRAVIAGVAAGAFVAATRVLLDLHWASDVVLALLFGVALLLSFLAVEPRLSRQLLPLHGILAWFRGSRWAWTFAGLGGPRSGRAAAARTGLAAARGPGCLRRQRGCCRRWR